MPLHHSATAAIGAERHHHHPDSVHHEGLHHGGIHHQGSQDSTLSEAQHPHFQHFLSHGNLSQDVGKLVVAEQDDDLRRVLRGVTRIGDAHDGVKVQRESVSRYLGELVKRRYESFQAPSVILFYVFFVLMLLGHDRIADLSSAEREFRGMLGGTTFEGLKPVQVSGHKNLGNIDSVADVYTYLQDAVLPLFIPSSNPSQELRRVLRYNQLIGGVALQQVRRRQRNCAEVYPGQGPFNENQSNPFLRNFSCFPFQETSSECFGPGEAMEGFCPDNRGGGGSQGYASQGRRLMPKKAAKGPKLASGAWQIVDHPAVGDKFSMVFHEHDGLDVALRHLQQLRDNRWIDESTAWVGIRLFVLNPDLVVYSSLVVNVFFLQSGELIPLQQAFSFMAEPFPDKSVLLLDALWILLWFQLLVQCIWSLFWGCYARDKRWDYLLNAWTWINWVTAIMGLVLIIQGVLYLQRLELIKDSAMAVAFNRPMPTSASTQVLQTYKDAVERMHEEIWDFNAFMDNFRRYGGFYCVILTIRLFKAFQVQPRAAIVLQTVIECLPDIAHFLVVLVTIDIAFVLSGMFLFGHRILHFSRFDMAFETSFLMIFGSLDFEELSEEHPTIAFFWFFLFIVTMYMILLNMALAIFMDAYGGMKNKAELSETVLDQLSGIGQTIRSWNQRVPAAVLLESVDSLETETVSKTVLMEACPSLEPKQAAELIDRVEAAESFEDEDSMTLSDAFRLVVSIRNAIVGMTEQVDTLVAVQSQRNSVRRQSLVVGGGQLHPDAERQLAALEGRAGALEEFLNEVMSYLVLRGKEARDRLEVIEEHLRKKGPPPVASASGASRAGASPTPQTPRPLPHRSP